MNDKYFDYIICGGGASGILLLRALRQDDYFEDHKNGIAHNLVLTHIQANLI